MNFLGNSLGKAHPEATVPTSPEAPLNQDTILLFPALCRLNSAVVGGVRNWAEFLGILSNAVLLAVPTALTYHYESQCIPTPGAWLAHQLPVWFQKLSVVATYVIEVAVPLLFFAPLRRLRLFAFYCQVGHLGGAAPRSGGAGGAPHPPGVPRCAGGVPMGVSPSCC